MLITNSVVITFNEPNDVLVGHSILIQNGQIADILPDSAALEKYPAEEIYNAEGKLVLPGNICAHTHFYGAFSRGMAIPGDAPQNFIEILNKLWWPLDKSLSIEDVKYSALLCEIDAIRHGTTTLFDHHASPSAIDGSLDVIADTVQVSGLRAALSYEVTDRGGPGERDAGIRENLRFINKVNYAKQDNLVGFFGLHAPITLSEETLEKCAAEKTDAFGFHSHVSESLDDQIYTQKNFQKNPIQWMDDFGILGSDSILAHCIHLNNQEISILRDRGVWVTHQPRSNMNNAVGVANVEQMLEAGVRVTLGNDGFSNSMWDEMKTAYLLHKSASHDPRKMNGYSLTEMAIKNNGEMASKFFRTNLGMIKKGYAADILIVDYKPPTELNRFNVPWHIVFGFRESMIESTIVKGKFLMKERKLLTLDETEIIAKCMELSKSMWNRYARKF